MIAHGHGPGTRGSTPRVGTFHGLPGHEAAQRLLDARCGRHIELHVAEGLGTHALEAALEAAQRVLDLVGVRVSVRVRVRVR